MLMWMLLQEELAKQVEIDKAEANLKEILQMSNQVKMMMVCGIWYVVCL